MKLPPEEVGPQVDVTVPLEAPARATICLGFLDQKAIYAYTKRVFHIPRSGAGRGRRYVSVVAHRGEIRYARISVLDCGDNLSIGALSMKEEEE